MLRAALPIALAAALLAANATTGTASAKKPVTCANAGKTLVKTKTARVYAQTVRSGHDKEERTYGCWLPTRDRLRLDRRCDHDDGSPQGDDACHDTPYGVVVNGRYVALTYCSFYNGEGGSTFSTVVWARLRKPAREEVVRIDNDADEQLGPFFPEVFVSKLGAIAYSAVDVHDGDKEDSVIGYVAPVTPGKEVDETTLDSGPLVDARSLTVFGNEIQWMSGGESKSAPWK
jgi:hypothetical protein